MSAADSGPTPHRALPLSADDRVASLSRTWYIFNCRGRKSSGEECLTRSAMENRMPPHDSSARKLLAHWQPQGIGRRLPMSGRRATRYVLLGVLGFLVAVFLALLVLTPIEIRSEAVRSFLESKVADASGGRFSYERLRVSLFPHPGASLLGVAFAKDPRLAVTATELTVCPQLLPLLRGELRPALIRVHGPDLRFSGPLFDAG
jgi:hypothetical protein